MIGHLVLSIVQQESSSSQSMQILQYAAFWGGLIALAYLAFLIWTLYDLLARQPQMDAVTKLLWAVLAFFPIVGILLYVLVVKRAGVTHVIPDVPFVLSPYDKLERLARLRQMGAITEEEFQAKKKNLMEQI